MSDLWSNGMDRTILDPVPAQLWSKAVDSFRSIQKEFSIAVARSLDMTTQGKYSTKLDKARNDLVEWSHSLDYNHRRRSFSSLLEKQKSLQETFQKGIDVMRYLADELLHSEDAVRFTPQLKSLDATLRQVRASWSVVTPAHVLLQTHQETVAREAGCFWPENAVSWPRMEHEFARRMEPILGARDAAFADLSETNLQLYLGVVDRFFTNLITVAPTDSELFMALPLHQERMRLADQLEAAALLLDLSSESTSSVRDTVTTSRTSGGASHG